MTVEYTDPVPRALKEVFRLSRQHSLKLKVIRPLKGLTLGKGYTLSGLCPLGAYLDVWEGSGDFAFPVPADKCRLYCHDVDLKRPGRKLLH